MRTAMVTGSASGIGAAVRRRLEADGLRVVGVDLRDAEITADLSEPRGRSVALAGIREAVADGLDHAVVCAGIGGESKDLAAVASVNYFGSIELLDGLLPLLRGREGASAVATCSNSAQLMPIDEHPYVLALLDGDEARARELAAGEEGFIVYAGSKQAVGRAVRRRAPEWGEAGVRLNAVAPGATETAMLEATRAHPVYSKGLEALPLPLGRTARPEEIAAVVAFLLGPEAAFVHGSIVYADGGTDATARPERF